MDIEITDDQIKSVFATRKYTQNYFNKVKDRIVRFVNQDENDDFLETLEEFQYVITQNQKSSIPKWVDAVRFSKLALNYSVSESWRRTFPDRYDAVKEKYPEEEWSKQVSLRANDYASGKMVTEIRSTMLVPTHIMYMGVRKDGVQKQIDLMQGKATPSLVPKYLRTSDGKLILDDFGQRQFLFIDGVQQFEEIYQVVSPKIQQEAAKAVIELTTAPDVLKIEANVTHGIDSSVIKSNVALSASLEEFAKAQREAALAGADINELQQVAHLVEKDVVDVDVEDDEDGY